TGLQYALPRHTLKFFLTLSLLLSLSHTHSFSLSHSFIHLHSLTISPFSLFTQIITQITQRSDLNHLPRPCVRGSVSPCVRGFVCYILLKCTCASASGTAMW